MRIRAKNLTHKQVNRPFIPADLERRAGLIRWMRRYAKPSCPHDITQRWDGICADCGESVGETN